VKRLATFLLVFSCLAAAQKPKPKPVPTPVFTVEYPFPLDRHSQIRDLQHKNDQLEVEIQKLEVKIAEMRGKQEVIVEAEKMIALQYAQEKKLDLGTVELDPADIKFVEKKK
jgi:TolA-binding protein